MISMSSRGPMYLIAFLLSTILLLPGAAAESSTPADVLHDNIFIIVLLIIAIVAFAIVYTLLSRKLKRFKKRRTKKLGRKAAELVVFTVKAVYWIIALTVLLNIAGRIDVLADSDLFPWLLDLLNIGLTFVILLLVMRILLIVVNDVTNRMKNSKKGVLKGVPPTTFILIQFVLRYLIIFIFGVTIMLIFLAKLGLYDLISGSISDFLVSNSNYISFIVVLVVIAFVAKKFIHIFIDDLKKRQDKFSPEMMDTAEKALTIVIYGLFALIIVFAILSMAGMAELGQTILVMMITMTGIVVAMVATGSIGNILSGMVLQSMKPFEVGDRVKIAEYTGDVEEMTLVFTRIRTLSNEVVDVPNNNVLAQEIFNYTAAETVTIDVTAGIGYEVPVELVRKLMLEGAVATDEVLKEPAPVCLATDFGDYAINYVLKAATDRPTDIPMIRSKLIENVQRSFYEAGVEILSPMYIVRRGEEPPDAVEVRRRYESLRSEGKET